MNVRRPIFAIVGIALLVTLITPATVLAETEENPYLVRTFVDEEGREIDLIVVPGRPPEKRISEASVSDIDIIQADATLSDVPAFDWCYGCSATSAAMMFGYYDRTGYSNMYAGPTNGGVCPLDNSAWGFMAGECPLSATHLGYDGLATKGHVDDYWHFLGSSIDPYHDYVPPWSEHAYADCTADFMGTNQWMPPYLYNTDGSTVFAWAPDGSRVYDCQAYEPLLRLGTHGMRLFVESRGYDVYHDGTNYQNYNQYIHEYVSGGFTFNDFKAEIDAGRPVIIQVTGHSMLGYGYDDPDTVYIHDTWNYNNKQMSWGGSYSGMLHEGVTVIHLQSVITSCDASGNEKNQFAPNQSVYVKGSGLEQNTVYNIWIQNDPVAEGETLAPGEDPSEAQETVTTGPGNGNPSGGFPATEIWPIPQSEPITHHPYDIVVDKVGGGEGTYSSTSDGIDSATVAGIVAPVPELPTIILLSIGLLVLVGYIQLKRKNRGVS